MNVIKYLEVKISIKFVRQSCTEIFQLLKGSHAFKPCVDRLLLWRGGLLQLRSSSRRTPRRSGGVIWSFRPPFLQPFLHRNKCFSLYSSNGGVNISWCYSQVWTVKSVTDCNRLPECTYELVSVSRQCWISPGIALWNELFDVQSFQKDDTHEHHWQRKAGRLRHSNLRISHS